MTPKQRDAIERHGKQLLAVFPNARERDPVALCKKLRRLEAKGNAFALRLCNGPEFASEEECEQVAEEILDKVNQLLGNYRTVEHEQEDYHGNVYGTVAERETIVPVFLNRDPRGYALKIDDTWMRERRPGLHEDWGGYGILAPEIGGNGQ